MVFKLKVRQVGNSLGMVLPREALARLNVENGDALYITESPEGTFRLTPSIPEFGRQMEVSESILRRYRNAFRELAK
jgi:putative addiction module antidote